MTRFDTELLLVTEYFYMYFMFYFSKICDISSSAADGTVDQIKRINLLTPAAVC